ncbi:MAG TPA: DISARM system phospholipase D-like protein DrmC [Blastocatellia bacterium]
MDDAYAAIAAAAGELARCIPGNIIRSLALAFAGSVIWDVAESRGRVLAGIAQPHYRSLAGQFVACYESHAGHISPQTAAMALMTAAEAERVHHDSQSLELVWTGPDSGHIPCRRTEQAILQILDSAVDRITLVSYAVYRVPHVRDALIRAAGRGVSVKVILETPDRNEGGNEYDTIRALGDKVAACTSLYYWPAEHRVCDESGKRGILHVKCAVSDGARLFLSSANLTEYAFTINMELGLLVTGGNLPRSIEEHFDRLVSSGVFQTCL